MPSFKSCELKSVDAIKLLPAARNAMKRISAGNSDLTLRIVKEQQPISRSDTQEIAKISWVSDDLVKLVEDDGIEPTTPCLQSRCSPS